MEKVISCCAGLDVHKESIEACVRRIEPDGRLHQKTQHWPTMTAWTGRRGKKRALVAVGNSLLVIFYHIMKRAASYSDLGGDFFERLELRASIPLR